MRLLAPTTLVELLQRLDRLVGRRDELLALARDADPRRRLRHGGVSSAVALRAAIRYARTLRSLAGQRASARAAVALRVGGALLGHGLATIVTQRLRLLELRLVCDAACDGLSLHQA